ncbi:MAG: hypothetical protein JW762_04930 [Dehalococcoidales bacterium]|nr:hypothetical protein [Dehalococcoidales bacterium]
MTELVFFIIGIVNSIALIAIFLIRKEKLDTLRRYGKLYFLLAIPVAVNMFLVFYEDADIRYFVFLIIFLLFLFVEWLYDYKIQTDFRENWLKNWKWTVPYLGLYWAMNYGFVVMPWKSHLSWGILMLVLFIIQIIANIRSHPKANT